MNSVAMRQVCASSGMLITALTLFFEPLKWFITSQIASHLELFKTSIKEGKKYHTRSSVGPDSGNHNNSDNFITLRCFSCLPSHFRKEIILRHRYCCPHYTAEEAETPRSNWASCTDPDPVWDSCPSTVNLPASLPNPFLFPSFLPPAMENAAFWGPTYIVSTLKPGKAPQAQGDFIAPCEDVNSLLQVCKGGRGSWHPGGSWRPFWNVFWHFYSDPF